MATYSVIIRNGLVFDGKGSFPIHADIGLEGDIIRAVGDLKEDQGAITVDASNHYVAPGFIDLTNHSDTHWTFFDIPRGDSMLKQGVTTFLGGNCGSSLAPLVHAEDIGGIQKWVDISRININWQEIAEFFEELEKHAFGLNIATLVGHGTLRRAIGMDITKPASHDEVEKMKLLLSSALKAGAFGLSTSLGRAHALSADQEELRSLFEVIHEFDALGTHHLQDEGADVVVAASHVVNLARKTRSRGHISHFKVLGRKSWPQQEAVLNLVESARGQDVKMTIDTFPYTRTGSNLYLLLPEWAREAGKEKILARLDDPEARTHIIKTLVDLTLHYDRITIASTLHDTGAVGKSISQLSESSGISPHDIIIELLLINDLQVSIFNETISEDNFTQVLQKDYCAISSDGVGLNLTGTSTNFPHPRSFGTFAKVFNTFVNERKILSWEEAIHKMTGLPASIAGLARRGVIEKGAHADVVIFDPEKIRDTADYQTPRRFSEGMEWVFVNGQAAISNGDFSGGLSGRVLKKT